MNSVGDLFKALSSGFLKYVYAWLVPSLVTTAAFAFVVLPEVEADLNPSVVATDSEGSTSQVSGDPSIADILTNSALFAASVLTLSTLFGLLSTPIYRVLEGYYLPRDLSRRLIRIQRRRRRRLERVVAQRSASEATRSNAAEELDLYPSDPKLTMPTRLGNALKATELYADTHYGMDSQRLWFELASLAPQSIRQDVDDTKAAIDFFVSFLAHLVLLSVSALGVAVVIGPGMSLGLGLLAALLVPGAYYGAVKNMDEYRSAVQALVNVGRLKVVGAFGLRPPATAEEEVAMWEGLNDFASPAAGDAFKGLSNLDEYRSESYPDTGAVNG